jgi:hypothetical protein
VNDNDRIIQKIKKCLALSADDRADPNMAAMALRQAQALMREHNISMGSVHKAEVGEGRAKTGSWRRPAVWELALAVILGRAFGCSYFIHYWKTGRMLAEIVFVGLNGQVETCTYAYEVIHRNAVKARARYVATLNPYLTRGQKMASGETFLVGFTVTIHKQITELVLEPAQKEAIALGVKDRMTNPDKKPYDPTKRIGTMDDYQRGVEEGSKHSVHRGVGEGTVPEARRIAT